MNTVLNFVLKYSGMQKLWDAVDGYKTKGAAAMGILTGLLGLATGLAPILAAHDSMGLWHFIQGLPTNPAWLLLVASIGGLGIGHKMDKAAEAVAIATPPTP